jgi:hypothetical protein
MHYALREYWNPTVHSPSTVKNYLATTNYFYKRKYPEFTHYFLFNVHLLLMIELIFYNFIGWLMCHILIHWPQCVNPLYAHCFLYSAPHLRPVLWRSTPPLHPTCVKFNHWAHIWILTKDFRRQIIHTIYTRPPAIVTRFLIFALC